MVYNDRELLARTLQAEAGNQGFGGMLAAGSVIANRVGSGGYGGSLRDVILKPGQFSAWNSLTGYAGGEQGQDMGNMRPSQDAYKAADAILSGNYKDPTGGATHYFNPDISQPEWGQSGQWKRIGDHVFGSADAGRSNKKGTSKMDQQQPTAQQMQQQQRGGLMGFLGNPRTREALLSMDRSGLFEGMRQRATADVAAQQEREALAAAEQKEVQQRNRTAEWLASQPGGEMFAEAIRSGMPAAKAYEAYNKSLSGDYVVVGKNLIDRKTGKVIFAAKQTASMTRFNPNTGQYETISGIDPSQLDLNESEGVSTMYGGRMQMSQDILDTVEREGTRLYQSIVSNVPVVGNYATSPEYKLYDQAKGNFINALLRRESGAAIADSEFERADKQYFPQPGDTDAVIAQKRQNRQLATSLMMASAGAGGGYAQQELGKLQSQIRADNADADGEVKTKSKNTIVEGM